MAFLTTLRASLATWNDEASDAFRSRVPEMSSCRHLNNAGDNVLICVDATVAWTIEDVQRFHFRTIKTCRCDTLGCTLGYTLQGGGEGRAAWRACSCFRFAALRKDEDTR